MKVVLVPFLLLLLHLMVSASAARTGPNPFFGYDPTPAPSDDQDSYSSYSSISSFARGYQPPQAARTNKSSQSSSTSTADQSSSADKSKQRTSSKKLSHSTSANKVRPLSSAAQSAAFKHFNLPMLSSASAPAHTYQPALFYKPVVANTYEAPADYNFDWSVKDHDSGNDFTHQETRDDDHTRGSYSVLLPDGRLQTVTYYVDGDSGYMAEVSYQDVKKYHKYPSKAHMYS